jgi:plastocyanin
MMTLSAFILALSAVVPAAMATYGGQTHTVEVGPNGMLAYYPEYVYADVGDTVQFNFNPKNHTVTQSAFDTPCVPLEYGIDSGFVPVSPDDYETKSFYVTVTDDKPVWIHCEQTGHCGMGMVFAINPPPDYDPHSFAAFKALAIATNGTAPPPPGYTCDDDGTYWDDSYSSDDGSYTPCDHQIIVGVDGQLAYGPPNITANVHDTVTFVFHPKNHTATQSSFENPCQPLADTSSTGEVGFNSGFMFVPPNATEFPTFQITIYDDKPIWGFCGQTGHCGSGMVFSINAKQDSDKNFDAFKALAIKINGTGGYTGGGSGAGY